MNILMSSMLGASLMNGMPISIIQLAHVFASFPRREFSMISFPLYCTIQLIIPLPSLITPPEV